MAAPGGMAATERDEYEKREAQTDTTCASLFRLSMAWLPMRPPLISISG